MGSGAPVSHWDGKNEGEDGCGGLDLGSGATWVIQAPLLTLIPHSLTFERSWIPISHSRTMTIQQSTFSTLKMATMEMRSWWEVPYPPRGHQTVVALER